MKPTPNSALKFAPSSRWDAPSLHVRPGMLRTLKFLGVFVLGIILGAVAMGFLASRATMTFSRNLEALYSIEQQRVAIFAARQGQWLTAAMAYRNIAEAESGDEKPFGVEQRNPGLLFPFAALVLEDMAVTADPEGKGRRMAASFSQAKYALALERSGHAEEATVEWEKALQYGYFPSVDAAREMAIKLLKQDLCLFNEQSK